MKISITIDEATPAEAQLIISAFSGGKDQNVKVVEVDRGEKGPATANGVKDAAPVAKVATTTNGATGPTKPTATTTVKPAPAAAAQPRVAGKGAVPTVATGAPAKTKPAPEPEPEVEEEEEEQEEETAEASAGEGDEYEVSDELLAEMKKATKIKDVLQPLMDLGIETIAGLVAKCEELKPDVPVLTRIPDLKERVTRAAEVLGIDT